MKKNIFIAIIVVLGLTNPSGKVHAQQLTLPDTSIVNDSLEKEEEDIIEDIISKRVPPQKDKVQYFSQVTKYGFKNLFNQFSYNSSLPYSSQVNPYAESFMQDYLKAHSKYLLKMKGWAQPYFGLIENVLTQYGLPRELKYVAVIESNLKNSAVSNKGACGPWQLMPGTARDLGLSVNAFIDERTDYYKSSHAAARYLLSLYRQLHDWLLVFAAYNGGPGRVYNAIKKSGSRNFWNLQYYLPEESRNYVKKFIATHYIMEGSGGVTTMGGSPVGPNSGPIVDQYEMNKPKLNEAEAEDVEVLAVSGKFNSLVIAKNLSIDITRFNRYNPNFDAMLGSTGNYDLRLPADKMQMFIANKYQILNECVQLMMGDEAILPPVKDKPSPKTPGRKKS